VIGQQKSGGYPSAARAGIALRLRARFPEIEGAVFARVRSLSAPVDSDDPLYVAGLRAAISAALVFGIDGVELGFDRPTIIPEAIVTQARRAARTGISLGIVLRRVGLVSKLLEDYVFDAATDLPSAVVHEILADQGLEVDRLMERVSAEYQDEINRLRKTSAERTASRIIELAEETRSVPRPETVAAFAATLAVGSRRIGGWADRPASAVRVRLTNDARGRLAYLIELPERDVPRLRGALHAYRGVELRDADEVLAVPEREDGEEEPRTARAEMALARPSFEPLARLPLVPDPLTPLAAALAGVRRDRGVEARSASTSCPRSGYGG
jgi:hypothetical protein